MSRDGSRHPPSEPVGASGHALGGGARDGVPGPRRGPRIELITPTPSKQEAAAIAAAMERFLAEAAPAPAAAPQARSAWQRAAIREGVESRAQLVSSWGERGGS